MMTKPSPRVLASYFHTPGAASQRLFHTVLRAGHVQSAPDDAVERQSYPGHDLLLCVAGTGFVRCNDRVFLVSAGQLAWIDCHRPHAHWAAPAEPWELYWIRIDGKQTRLFANSLAVGDMPIFRLRDSAAAIIAFRRIFALLNERSLAIDAALHAAVAGLIALLFEARLLRVSHRRTRFRQTPGRPQNARPACEPAPELSTSLACGGTGASVGIERAAFLSPLPPDNGVIAPGLAAPRAHQSGQAPPQRKPGPDLRYRSPGGL